MKKRSGKKAKTKSMKNKYSVFVLEQIKASRFILKSGLDHFPLVLQPHPCCLVTCSSHRYSATTNCPPPEFQLSLLVMKISKVGGCGSTDTVILLGVATLDAAAIASTIIVRRKGRKFGKNHHQEVERSLPTELSETLTQGK
ncbi:Uncharacterized protein Fot_01517 [Forsythia ovata]|uniref:Uncharacterized protein n=1 Tax=Forsythia ovata TaxID=205694 RepID=A0ABD1X774_9LAMI